MAQMFSGKLTTSANNTHLIGEMTIYIMSLINLEYGVDYDFLAEGDDTFIGFNDIEHYKHLVKYLTLLGFKTSDEHFNTIDEAEFCGNKIFIDSHGDTFTYRDPSRVFRKIGFTTCPNVAKNKRMDASVLCGKAVALYACLGSAPTIVKIVRQILAFSEHVYSSSKIIRQMLFETDFGANLKDYQGIATDYQKQIVSHHRHPGKRPPKMSDDLV